MAMGSRVVAGSASPLRHRWVRHLTKPDIRRLSDILLPPRAPVKRPAQTRGIVPRGRAGRASGAGRALCCTIRWLGHNLISRSARATATPLSGRPVGTPASGREFRDLL